LFQKLLRLAPAFVLVSMTFVALTTTRQAAAEGKKAVQVAPGDAGLVRQIHRYRAETWRWQSVMGASRTPAGSAAKDPSHRFKVWARNLWRKRAHHARHAAARVPHKSAWLCIHRYEGAWNDPNGPYYGGLQMDVSFQRHYGPGLYRKKGTADHWTPLEQMWVAERAHRSGRGFYPWPNTARYCGLI
jgi:hypothetical protein